MYSVCTFIELLYKYIYMNAFWLDDFVKIGVEAFKTDVVSETILMRLLKQDVIFHIKMKDKERFKSDPASIIYQQGKPVDYFVLILEGRVEVTVGRENLVFESGPFTYFGSQALHQNIGIGELDQTKWFTKHTLPNCII